MRELYGFESESVDQTKIRSHAQHPSILLRLIVRVLKFCSIGVYYGIKKSCPYDYIHKW